MDEKKSVFQTLREIDLTEKHKEKNKLTYLPWANAWAAVKTVYPDATWHPVHFGDNLYSTDGKTCRVETEVTIDGLTQGETLAVMDYRNAAIPFEKVTATDVDKSIRRCLTKNLALFGLDLNLWVGEEISDEVKELREEEEAKEKEKRKILEKNIDIVCKLGTDLINNGVSKTTIIDIVKKYNEDGNGNPASLPDVESCEKVIEEFNKLSTKKEK